MHQLSVVRCRALKGEATSRHPRPLRSTSSRDRPHLLTGNTQAHIILCLFPVADHHWSQFSANRNPQETSCCAYRPTVIQRGCENSVVVCEEALGQDPVLAALFWLRCSAPPALGQSDPIRSALVHRDTFGVSGSSWADTAFNAQEKCTP